MDGLTFTYQFHRRANNLQKDENYAFKQFKRLCAWTSIYIFHGRASNQRMKYAFKQFKRLSARHNIYIFHGRASNKGMKLCIQTVQAPVCIH